MKLKYYLRGLGIGIIVMTLIFSIAGGEKEVLSDAEIRERAMQLGMVDSSSLTLSELQSHPAEETPQSSEAVAESSEAIASSEAAMESGEAATETPDSNANGSQEGASSPSVAPQQSVAEATPTPSQSTEPVAIVITSGQSSYTVSKTLAAAGLVADAADFDTYLCDNGYSRRITTGTYEILPGTDEEEIAKIITGKR